MTETQLPWLTKPCPTPPSAFFVDAEKKWGHPRDCDGGCSGSGRVPRFEGLSVECPSLYYYPHSPANKRGCSCHEGRVANVTVETVLDASMDATGSAHVEMWWIGSYWVVRFPKMSSDGELPIGSYDGHGATRLAAAVAALEQAVEEVTNG